MKPFYKGNSKKSGIYKIINTTNNRIYIGSAKEFKSRLNCHLLSLRNNKHSNKFLQNDFNKCGEEVFEFHILEIVEGEQKDRFLREQYYVDQYYDGQQNCYNFMKETNKESKSCQSRNPEETSRKRSQSAKKMWQDPEFRKKHSESQSAHTKEQWQNPKFREEHLEILKNINHVKWDNDRIKYMSEHMKNSSYGFKPKTYSFLNPEDELIEITGLTQFIKNNKELNKSGIDNLLSGKIQIYKGWMLPGTIRSEALIKKPKTKGPPPKIFNFIKPNGEHVSIYNLAEFCRNNPEFHQSSLNLVHLGHKKSYKDWIKQ